jgi:hexulose-6-phosphate isomerase
VPAVVNAEVGYDQAWERSSEEIARVLPRAAELGVAIAIENVWNQFLLSPLEAARYIDQFESPSIGFHFDVGNVVNYGWPQQWVRILGSRILKLDIKEFSRAKRDREGLWKGFEVEIGDGDCGWPAVVAALDEVGYRGWATAEVGGGDAARLADIARRMRRVLGV